MTLQNRFDPLIHDADSAPAVSRPEEFAMTEASSTESQELGRPSRRLRLVWNPATQDEEAAPVDSHDQRLERVRRVVQRERNDRRVLAAAERIGFVDPSFDWAFTRGHCAAGGRGPRITCNHPFGTSTELHPLRGMMPSYQGCTK